MHGVGQIHILRSVSLPLFSHKKNGQILIMFGAQSKFEIKKVFSSTINLQGRPARKSKLLKCVISTIFK